MARSSRRRKKAPARLPARIPVPAIVGDTPAAEATLLGELRELIEASRQQVARTVNSAMVLTYWRIGERIGRDVLSDERGAYGQQVMGRLADELSRDYGSGFSRRSLFNTVRVARAFPGAAIVQTLSAQLGWSHFVILAAMDDPLRREFYSSSARRSGGACARCSRRSMRCCSSGPPSPASPKRS